MFIFMHKLTGAIAILGIKNIKNRTVEWRLTIDYTFLSKEKSDIILGLGKKNCHILAVDFEFIGFL